MTILAAVRSRRALVIGSDSEERSSGIPRHTTKILCPQPNLVLAWAGYKDVAQAMALGLQEEPLDLRLPRSKLAGIARERFKNVRSDPDVEHRGDLNEFMLGWYCESERKPVGLHLPGRGSALWIEHWHYAGSPSAVATARVAEAAVSYVVTDELGAEQLSLLALKVVRDSINSAPATAGIGGDVQLAMISSNGVHVVEPA